jgi:hypothetical protein
MLRFLLISILLLLWNISKSQFAPAAGEPGSTAIWKDSTIFKAWATGAEIIRGPLKVGVDSLGFASAGEPELATGIALSNGSVSLGDGGQAILTFPFSIKNGPGYDFAVFENSFDGIFLELAFVEVSSDGENYVRFPATSLTDTTWTIGPFDYLEATKLNNLAGKYKAGFGTPFDLEELSAIADLNVNAITHIRLVDVIGSNQNEFCSRDAGGRKVLDPWPTPFPSCGFDLDAVGVIHHNDPAFTQEVNAANYQVFPQPADGLQQVIIQDEIINFTFLNIAGSKVAGVNMMKNEQGFQINTSTLQNGTYYMCIQLKNNNAIIPCIVAH